MSWSVEGRGNRDERSQVRLGIGAESGHVSSRFSGGNRSLSHAITETGKAGDCSQAVVLKGALMTESDRTSDRRATGRWGLGWPK